MEVHPEAARGQAPERFRLERGQVHLWWGRMGAAEDPDALRGWLSDEELLRGERFHRERDAREFRFRRAFRRVVLAPYVGTTPAALRFTDGRFGKPALADDGELAFNGASRDGLVLLGVARGVAIGVDLERASGSWADPEEIARLLPLVATPAEARALLSLEPDARARAFARLWTRKESLLKALGTGLSRDPRTVAVGLGGDDPPADAGTTWLAPDAPDGYVASAALVAAAGSVPP